MKRSILALIAVTGFAALGQDMADVEIRTTKLGHGIAMLEGRGGNIGVCVGDDGVFMIDDQFAPLTEKILAAVGELTDEPVEFVLNTHWHGDHTGGNEKLGKAGAVIIAHENVRARMSVDQLQKLRGRTIKASPEGALPVVTFNDTVTFHWNDQTIRVFHVPHAHTDGDSIVHFREANIIHMGDVYFNGLYPFIDADSGGMIDGVIAAVEKVLPLIDDRTKVIPGHGPLSNRAELMTYLEMLRDVRSQISNMIRSGSSVDEVIAAKPSAKYDERLGGGFLTPDQFVGLVYAGMARTVREPE